MKRAFQPTLCMVEVRLIDGGAGKAVFDVHIHMIFSQAQPHLLPGGIHRNDGATGVLAVGHPFSGGSGSQLTGPRKSLRSSHRRENLRWTSANRLQFLAGFHNIVHTRNFDASLGDDHGGLPLFRLHAEPCSQRHDCSRGCHDFERLLVQRLIKLGYHLDKHFPALNVNPTR